MAVGLAHRTVHVEDELGELAVLMGLVDPLPGESIRYLRFSLVLRVSVSKRAISLVEAAVCVLGPAADHGPQGGIEAEAFGVVDILVAGQPAVDRLAEEGEQAVLRVLSGAGVVQAGRRCAGQSEGVVEFAVGEESGVTGDGGAVELQLDLAVEIDAEGVVLAVTHWVPRSFRQEVVGNAGFSGENGANAMPKRPSHLGNMGL